MKSKTVFDNIALPLELTNTPKETIEKTVYRLLELTQLSNLAQSRPIELSPGQRQLVALARALVTYPKVLLCEHPTASMDSKTKLIILQVLKHFHEHFQTTIVLITHELELIKTLCNQVAVLHRGEIVEQTSVIEFFMRPRSAIGKEFIKASARSDIPSALKNTLRPKPASNHNPILRISFQDPSTQESFIGYVVQQFSVSVNIIQAHLEEIKEQTVGIMTVEMIGEESEIKRAIEFLEFKDIYVEVLGYAQRTL